MSKPSVLLIGAGFVGGTVLDRLLKQGYPVSVTYRREDQASVLKSLGVTPIQASLDDAESIEEAVSKHAVLINTASSDHPGSVEASLKGIERRVKQGLKTVYIHTSGTGVLADSASGVFNPNAKVYSDDDPASIEGLPPKAPHRAIDKALAHRAAQWASTGLVQLRVIIPPLIWGKGSGPFNQHSIQIPAVIKASFKAKAAVSHGPGTVIWSQVNVQDLADGYIILLEALLKGDLAPQSQFDYYVFAENGDFAWIEVSQRIQAAFQAKGVVSKDTPIRHLSDTEAFEYGLAVPKAVWDMDQDLQIAGSNSISRATKLKKLGWQPKNSTKEQLLASLEEEVDQVRAKQTA